MDANEREWMNRLIEKVVGAVYEVANTLGAGFLEKVYERALVAELRLRGIRAEGQVPLRVVYKGEAVGDYYIDILVENKLVLELKCVQALTDEHLAQTLNYLKATGHQVALLINFQHPKVEWRRIVHNF
ncbi:MAG: GxxExxY protein [Acidobacteria bacterium]|nr:GxxExxY protein [Acidobacteriota bacterium]